MYLLIKPFVRRAAVPDRTTSSYAARVPARHRPVALLTAAVVALAPGVRGAEPAAPTAAVEAPIPEPIAARLEAAGQAFMVQDYPRVVELLEALSGHPALTGRAEHRRLLEWLGASHWFSGNRDAARIVLGALLRESPFHVLDGFIYPPELIEDFERLRAGLPEGGVIPGRPPDPVEPPRTILRIERRDVTPTAAYLAPFGVGQFANGEPGKGALLASLQGVGAAAMVATWLGIESLKADGTNRIPPADGGTARALDALWYAGLALLTTSWVWSVSDGLVYRDARPRLVEERVVWPAAEPAREPPAGLTPPAGRPRP